MAQSQYCTGLAENSVYVCFTDDFSQWEGQELNCHELAIQTDQSFLLKEAFAELPI